MYLNFAFFFCFVLVCFQKCTVDLLGSLKFVVFFASERVETRIFFLLGLTPSFHPTRERRHVAFRVG